MREIAGGILVLAGAVLIAAGIVADAVTSGRGGFGSAGCVMGTVVGLVGGVFLLGGPLRRLWDAIPVDDKKASARRADAESDVRGLGMRVSRGRALAVIALATAIAAALIALVTAPAFIYRGIKKSQLEYAEKVYEATRRAEEKVKKLK